MSNVELKDVDYDEDGVERFSVEEEESNELYSISAQELSDLNEAKEVSKLIECGGVERIAKILGTDLKNGLSGEMISDPRRIELYGKNEYPQKKPKNFLRLVLDALKDTMLILLLVLAVVSIVLGLAFPEREEDRALGWIEGAAIIMAVAIVTLVTAINDYSKERKFLELNKASADVEVSVIREGHPTNVLMSKLLVGDIVQLKTGDGIPGDGIMVTAFGFKADESVMTGETDLIKKNTDDKPFIISGCQVSEGTGTMLITAVGENNEWGKTLKKLNDEDDDSDTPLTQKLDKLAGLIGKLGTFFAVSTFLVLLAGWLIKKIILTTRSPPEDKWQLSDIGIVVKFIVIAVTIVVVAVPEGLPLAVTISLAYSVSKMMKDNNLVRKLEACETMGGATNICSDKTGTLTLNQMRVVQGYFGGEMFDTELPTNESFSEKTLKILHESISINTGANLIKSPDSSKEFEVQGNKTESALLIYLKSLNEDYALLRKEYDVKKLVKFVHTFSSLKKRMSTVVSIEQPEEGKNLRLICKGASEIVLDLCSTYIDLQGNINTITDDKRQEMNNAIITMADQGLRTLCLAYKDLDASEESLIEDQESIEKDMTCICIVGIKDPLRPEVIQAVKQCKSSGIFVRMVTGDNIRTASYIARECGILDDSGFAIEGPVWRRMSDEEKDEKIGRLQVMARSSPTDKFDLVKRLKAHGEVVGVTGDGTNDAPALKAADVGLSMGLSGTFVAKQASDIVILDDNFNSIVKAVLWGRSIFENIRKFLQFQLTVNVVALVLTITTALTSFIIPPSWLAGETASGHLDPPLTAVQLLWVNLIMDTFAALALATENPVPELLERKPYGRKESLITLNMWITLLGQSLYQLVVLLVIYYGGVFSGISSDFETNNSLVFNTFVFCQIFNELNCRKINNEWNILAGIHNSIMFLAILAITIVTQVIIIQFRFIGQFAQTHPLGLYQWIVSVAIGMMCIPFGYLLRILCRLLFSAKSKAKGKEEDKKAFEYQQELE